MTPAQQVAVDAMHEAWAPEVVELMLRAVEPEYMEALATILGEEAQRSRIGYRHQCPDCRRTWGHNSQCRVMRALELLSPAETPAGASTHRPEVCTDCHVYPCRCDHDRFPGAGAG